MKPKGPLFPSLKSESLWRALQFDCFALPNWSELHAWEWPIGPTLLYPNFSPKPIHKFSLVGGARWIIALGSAADVEISRLPKPFLLLFRYQPELASRCPPFRLSPYDPGIWPTLLSAFPQSLLIWWVEKVFPNLEPLPPAFALGVCYRDELLLPLKALPLWPRWQMSEDCWGTTDRLQRYAKSPLLSAHYHVSSASWARPQQ